MQAHTIAMLQQHGAVQAPDERLVMLEEVDFKWLMAGQGWWVDTERLHKDPTYAAHLLNLVQDTESEVLKDCAILLRAQVATQH